MYIIRRAIYPRGGRGIIRLADFAQGGGVGEYRRGGYFRCDTGEFIYVSAGAHAEFLRIRYVFSKEGTWI